MLPDDRLATSEGASWEDGKGVEKCVLISDCSQTYKVDGAAFKIADKEVTLVCAATNLLGSVAAILALSSAMWAPWMIP